MTVYNSDRFSILIVDDDPSVSALVRRNLEDRNTRVIEAATGIDGIKILGKSKVDLVLLDLKLPDLSGWGILSLLKLTEPLRHIPVILVSVEPASNALIKQFKPDDYIEKPFDVRELLLRVRRLLRPQGLSQNMPTAA